MKKVPPNAEATNVLVGAVDFLETPIYAFVRLSRGLPLPDLIEVPLPTRFLFVLLGPSNEHLRYHEIGRSIATLMADEVKENKLAIHSFWKMMNFLFPYRYSMMLLIELAIETISSQVNEIG